MRRRGAATASLEDDEVPSTRIDVMIAGAQKAGTTSLVTALGSLQGVLSSHPHEFTWFIDPDRFGESYEEAFVGGFGRVGQPDEKVVAKSASLMFLPAAAERLHLHNACCKILMTLRHPVDRAWSAYWFLRRVGIETAATFERALALEEERLPKDFNRYHEAAYRARGDYAPQVSRMQAMFGEDNVRVLLLEDIREDLASTVADVASWISLSTLDEFELPVERVHVNAAARARSEQLAAVLRRPWSGPLRPLLPARLRRAVRTNVKEPMIRANERSAPTETMRTETRQELLEWFAPRNDALASLLGRDLQHWSS
jgi:hypothetical protein